MSSDFDKTVNQATASIHLLQLHNSPVMRWLYLGIGIMALFMGILGIFLPILPTTPFVLLAAGCFARSSERFHNYLLSHRVAGPIIQEWCQYRSVARKVKHWAYLVMSLSFGSSILIVPSWGLKGMLIFLAVILFMFIWRLPVRDIQSQSR